MKAAFVLASASPRRKEILSMGGFDFCVIPSGCKEIVTKTHPADVVMELAVQKAMDVFQSSPEQSMVIGADTVVSFENEILGKPRDREDALRMLSMLAGNTHQVFTGVCMAALETTHVFYETTRVTFYPMDSREIQEYVQTGEYQDKAGGYGIQGGAARYIKGIEGDYYNVMGFPLARFVQELKHLGIQV